MHALQFEDMPDIEIEELEALPELTEIEVEELLARLSEINANVKSAEERRDSFVNHYAAKIERAKALFYAETAADRAEIDSITDTLQRYTLRHLSGKKRSINLPSGTLQLTKQQPKFIIKGQVATNDNPVLIELARRIDTALVKVAETADWAKLKTLLKADVDGKVYLKDTGEILPDMQAEFQPDKFSIKTI